MKGLKRFATERPVLFSVVTTSSVLAFYILAGILAEILTEDDVDRYIIEVVGRLIGSLIFLFVIWRLSWQEATGVTRLGSLIAWIAVALILLYEVITQLVPYLDNVAFGTIAPAETAPAALNAFLAGIYYAAIVLRWKTLWTVAVLHSLLNVAATVVAYNIPGFEEEVSALLLAIAFQVPLVILGACLISRIKPRSIVPDTV